MSDDPLAGIPESMGREWIRESIARGKAERKHRASQVRTPAARELLALSRTVIVDRGKGIVTIVDDDILYYIKAIETEQAAGVPVLIEALRSAIVESWWTGETYTVEFRGVPYGGDPIEELARLLSKEGE